MSSMEVTQLAESCVQRLNNGDSSAFDDLLRLSRQRIENLTRKLLTQYPRVRRWEQTDDIYQQAAIRLHQALASVRLTDARHFLRLMALQIRRELIDLARRHCGPQGHASHHRTQGSTLDSQGNERVPAWAEATAGDDPAAAAEWSEFHELIERLPDEQRELFDLIYYHEMPQAEVAELLGTSERTVRRRWREARMALSEMLPGNLTIDE